MKSRTSFFNGTVLRKDITRFAPVWALYTIFLLLRLPALGGTLQDCVQELVRYDPSSMPMINLFYAFICATMVFGDLFKTSACNALHAMPLRREGWFATHATAGFLFGFLPQLLYTLICMLYVREYSYVPLANLAMHTMQYLYYFGLASFSAMCAGNRLGMAAVYFTLNYLPLLLGEYINVFYMPLLNGVQMNMEPFEVLTPVTQMSEANLNFSFPDTRIVFIQVYADRWIYAGVVAVAGLVLGALALLLYRKRKLEAAGDFIALQAAKPVFLILFSLMSELLFFMIVYIPVLGMIIGYFACRMLQERTVRVFKWKYIWRLLVLIVLYVVSLVVTWLDPIGITRYVPEADQIEKVYCYDDRNNYYYQGEPVHHHAIEDPEQIEQCRQFHQRLIQYRQEDGSNAVTEVYLVYQLKNGSTVERRYYVSLDSLVGQEAQKWFSSWEYVFYTEDWDALLERVELISVEPVDQPVEAQQLPVLKLGTPEQIRLLMEAIRADCDAGTMAQGYPYRDQTVVTVNLHMDSFTRVAISLDIDDDCVHTLAALEALNNQ